MTQFAVIRHQGRVTGCAIFAALLVIAIVCFLQTSKSSGEIMAEEDKVDLTKLGGVALVEAQAKHLDEIADAKNAGNNMASVDSMLHNFQETEDPNFTADLVKAAPEPDAWGTPDKNGNIKKTVDLHTVDQSMVEEEDDNDILLQQQAVVDDTEWVPQGQHGMSESIKQVRAAAKDDELKQDGIKGDTILSAAGLEAERDPAIPDIDAQDLLGEDSDTNGEMMLFQAPKSNFEPDDEEDESLTIKKAKLPKARELTSNYDYDGNAIKEPKEEPLGNDILSAIGMGDQEKDEIKELGTLKADDLDFTMDLNDEKA